MRKSLLSVLALLALVVAACGGGTADPTTTTSGDATIETPAPVDVPDAQLLSYSLEAGNEYQYEVNLVQSIDMTATGEGAAAEDEEFPGDASFEMAASAVFTYTVAAGPEEGTYAVTIKGEFTDIAVTGTVDGESINDEADIPDMADLAGLDPIDITVIVDEQGNIVGDDTELADPLAGMFGDLGALGTDTAPGMNPGQFVGIPFSDEEVTVGDTWSEEIETPGLDEEPITTSINSTVTGTDTVDGTDVLIIETITSTSPIEFDLAEFLIGFLTAFGAPEGEDAAEFDAMIEQIRFFISITDADSKSTTAFDSEAGIARQYDLSAGANIFMDINVPDEESGEISGFTIDMTIDQDLDYRLVSTPPA
jgi:hypothetical protein